MKRFLLPAIFLCNVSIFSQVSSTSAQRVLEALGEKMKMEEESIVKNIRFINIGPDIMSGRVADIEVNPANTIEFYVGYASGGLWYTQNNGTSFMPVLDSSQSQNVGDLAVDWKTGTIWV